MELGVAFDEFFCAATGEADGEAAVVFIAFDGDDGADAEFGMADFTAEHGIGWGAARSRTAEGGSFRTRARRCSALRCGRDATDATDELFGGVRIFGIGFVAAGLADFRHGADGSVHEFTGNFREKTRGLRCAELLLVAENAAVDGASEGKRFSRAGHADVNEAALFFHAFFFVDGTTVRADALFHAGEKNVIEFEALGAVKGDERGAGFVFERVGVADERGGVEKIGERFAGVHAFRDGAGEFFEIFDARDVFGRVAILEHGHVAGFVENVTEKAGRFAFSEGLLEANDQFLKRADGSGGAARGGSGEKRFDRGPNCGVAGAGGFAEVVDGGFADAARRNVQDAEKGDVVLGMHGEANVSEGVFDFGAIVKAETADQFVAEAAAAKGFFESARLKIGAVLDGAGLAGIIVENFLELDGNEFGFGLGVAGFEVTKIRAGGRFGFERFAEAVGVVFYDGAGGVENILRGAVVAFEADDARGGKIARKAE